MSLTYHSLHSIVVLLMECKAPATEYFTFLPLAFVLLLSCVLLLLIL